MPYIRQDGHLPSGAAYYRWLLPEPRAILVIQHGYAEYACRYMSDCFPLRLLLEELRFEIWAMDLWGHGASPGVRNVVHVGKAVRDHLALRDVVLRRGLPLYLFGHSLGGLVTCGSVVSNSGGVEGVILSSPALIKPHIILVRAIAGLGARILPSRPVPLKSEPTSCLSHIPEEIKRYEEDEQICKRQIGFLLGATALDCGQIVWSSREDWKVPTLLLHGTADKATSCDTSRLFMEGIVASDKQTSLLEDGYHELLRDSCQEEVLAIIRDWLTRRLRV